MWFILSLLTAFAWGAANLCYKKGSNTADTYSHIKIVTTLVFARGDLTIISMAINAIIFDSFHMIRYFPVSFMYILSMTLGYVGLRYIELSIAAPVQNSSGAASAILLFIFFPREMGLVDISGIIIVTIGVIGL